MPTSQPPELLVTNIALDFDVVRACSLPAFHTPLILYYNPSLFPLDPVASAQSSFAHVCAGWMHVPAVDACASLQSVQFIYKSTAFRITVGYIYLMDRWQSISPVFFACFCGVAGEKGAKKTEKGDSVAVKACF